MAKIDTALGERVRAHLENRGLETLGPDVLTPKLGEAQTALRNGVKSFLGAMGLDTEDPSLQDTPTRVAEMYAFELCAGLDYTNFPKCTVTPNGVEGVGNVDEMVMVDSIQTTSLCEHHFQTISGLTHIAYIPGKNLLGLSKFARVTDFFARRPQVQERMTEQIHAALTYILGTEDVAVSQVCVHNCMRARGAMDPHSKTTTIKLGGRFRNAELRAEFLQAIPRRVA